MEFSVPLLTLLQLQSYLVACISSRIFIIPKLQNIYWRQFFNARTLSELFSLCIESLSNCHSVRYYFAASDTSYRRSDWAFREHISSALPIKRIFYQLRSIHPNFFIQSIPDGSRNLKLQVETLEIIIKWLQVSVSESNRQTPQAKNLICVY